MMLKSRWTKAYGHNLMSSLIEHTARVLCSYFHNIIPNFVNISVHVISSEGDLTS